MGRVEIPVSYCFCGYIKLWAVMKNLRARNCPTHLFFQFHKAPSETKVAGVTVLSMWLINTGFYSSHNNVVSSFCFLIHLMGFAPGTSTYFLALLEVTTPRNASKAGTELLYCDSWMLHFTGLWVVQAGWGNPWQSRGHRVKHHAEEPFFLQ